MNANIGQLARYYSDSLSFRFTGKNEARAARGTAIITSHEEVGYEGKYAIDSDRKTEWRSNEAEPHLILTFPNRTTIDRVFICESKDGGYKIAEVNVAYKVNVYDAAWTDVGGVTKFPMTHSGMIEFPTRLAVKQLKLTFYAASGYVGVREIETCLQELYFMKALGDGFETGNPSAWSMQPDLGRIVHTTGLPCRVSTGRGKRDIINMTLPEVIGYPAVELFEDWVERQDEVGIITDQGFIFFGLLGSPSHSRNPTDERFGETYNVTFPFYTVR